MGDISSGSTFVEAMPNAGRKMIVVRTESTADTADTVVLDLSDYGISTLLAVEGFIHTTDGSVVEAEAPTTAVSSGDLTITIGGSTVSDKRRVYFVYGY